MQWSVLPLADNREADEHQYEIHVYTGTGRGAGTRSKVKLIIAGTDGDTGVRELHDDKRKVL